MEVMLFEIDGNFEISLVQFWGNREHLGVDLADENGLLTVISWNISKCLHFSTYGGREQESLPFILGRKNTETLFDIW
jgi:hypothetical protein